MQAQGIPDVREEIAAATPEQRRRLIAAICQVIEEEFNTPQASRKGDGIGVLGRCALALKNAGDESATIAAFGSRLTQVGFNAEGAVISALIVCRDPKAVEALAALGRFRLKQVKELVPPLRSIASATDEQKRAADNIFDSLGDVIAGLTFGANSSGKPIAREFRDEIVKLIEGSPYQKEASKGLAEIDSYLREATEALPSGSRTSVAGQTTHAKQFQQTKTERSAVVTLSTQKQGRSSITTAIAVVVVSLVIVGLLIWFLRKK